MLSQIAIAPEGTRSLSYTELDQFARLGYLVLPGFLPDRLVSRLMTEADRWVDDGLRARSIACCVDPDTHGLPPVMELELQAHGELISHAPVMGVLSQLMGPDFVFHHLHSDRQAPGTPGKAWHHDYEQNPQVNRDHAMIHTLHYPNGLDAKTSVLAVLPGSHRVVAAKTARAHLGTQQLPGEVVISRLPRGSTVVLHSALLHARRPKPGTPDRCRYLIDASYCQVGALWPPVKPYWRHMLGRARELELDRGRWPELFAERHFTEYVKPA